MNNYDELRQAGNNAIAEGDHVCITGELLLQLLDENAALRAVIAEAVRGKVVNNWTTGGEDICLVCGELPKSGIHDDDCWVPKAQQAIAGAEEQMCRECVGMSKALAGTDLEDYPHDITTCACVCHEKALGGAS